MLPKQKASTVEELIQFIDVLNPDLDLKDWKLPYPLQEVLDSFSYVVSTETISSLETNNIIRLARLFERIRQKIETYDQAKQLLTIAYNWNVYFFL